MLSAGFAWKLWFQRELIYTMNIINSRNTKSSCAFELQWWSLWLLLLPQELYSAHVPLVLGLLPEMSSTVMTDSEQKDPGTLVSVPIIRKNANRWSREIISSANYPNGWAQRTLHSPKRAKGSHISGQCWPNWLLT